MASLLLRLRSPSISHSSSADMAALEVNLKLLLQLQAMDFPFARAARALHSTRNVGIEEAVNWIIDHGSDPLIDHTPSVTFGIDIESSSSFILSEEMRKKTKKLLERVQKNEAREERHDKEGRNMKLLKGGKEEEKSSREKIPQKLKQDKVEGRRTELFDKRSETIKCSLKSSLPSTMSSKKAEWMRECLKSMKQNYKEDVLVVRRAFQTLLIYVGNVAKHPNDEKFRRIRLTNPIFQERVGSLKGGVEFLEACGFERREGEFLHLPPHKVDVNSLKSAGFLLNSALSNPFFGLLSP